ncbi:MAG TPA: Hsp20/alpha crystallin family protein [Verrucomicrobiae bacterium]|nr:Hsp20/alpha crystallin family protein [Verrucomicrobiae bacterium]
MNATISREERKDLQNQARAQNFVTPEVNIFETKDGYVLEAEMPGVSKEGLEITLEGNELVIVGRREKEELKAGAIYRESSTADYRRMFELDPAIDTTKIDAKVEQGVLTIQLPKSERVKPRKVTVSD